jgi:type I restriction enzyme S subunit
MTLPRYPNYKDSGVEWLGEVPGHWGVMPVKQLASIVNGYPFDSALFDSSDGFPLVRIRDLDKSVAETFYKGEFVGRAAITSDDVLIGMDGDFNVGRWRGTGPALLNQRMCCVRGKSDILTRLLEYSLPVRLKAINDITYATTVKHLASSQVEKMFVTVPPDPEEQTKIAAFLDRETAKIDELVAEQRRLVELLKEKRQAVISHAVTRGLNPDALLKPSGIEWLGDVPEHWVVCPLKHVVSLKSGGTPSKSNFSYWDGDVPWASSKDLKVEELADTQDHITQQALDEGAAELVAAGSLLIVVRGMILIHTFPVVKTLVPMAINQDLKALTPCQALNIDFLALLLRGSSRETLGRVDEAAHGTKVLRLEDWTSLPLPIPPVHEQLKIVAEVVRRLAQLDTLTTEAQRAIDLLQERRTALISAAVTGQIDVRGAVAA